VLAPSTPAAPARCRAAWAVAIGLALGAGTAAVAPSPVRADGGVQIPGDQRSVVSLPLLGLGLRSLALQGERYLGCERRFSVVAGVGLRAAAGGDYGSLTLSLSGEGRLWFHRPARGSGAFTAVRLDLGHTAVTDTVDDRALAATWAIALGGHIGWRWLIRDQFEITPSLGLGARYDVPEGRLTTGVKPVIALGLTVGWRF
jgi:hypothetical protein